MAKPILPFVQGADLVKAGGPSQMLIVDGGGFLRQLSLWSWMSWAVRFVRQISEVGFLEANI